MRVCIAPIEGADSQGALSTAVVGCNQTEHIDAKRDRLLAVPYRNST